jgi:hypothetical protein
MLTVKKLKHICDLIGKKGPDGAAITEEEISNWDSVRGPQIFATDSRNEAEAEAANQGRKIYYKGADGIYYVGDDDVVAEYAPEDTYGIFVELD